MLNKTIYAKGIGMLASAFQNYKMTPKVMYPYLEDLTDEEFTKAVNEVIKTVKGLYPNDNIIAIIREKARGDESKEQIPYHIQFQDQAWMKEKQIEDKERKQIK